MSLRCIFTLTSSTHRSKRSAVQDMRYHMGTYLDETGKIRLNARADRGLTPFRGPDLANTNQPVLPGLPSEEGVNRIILPEGYFRGRQTVGGFFKDRVVLQGLGRNSPQPPTFRAKWVDKVAQVWAMELGRYRSYSEKKGPLVRHNFSLSLDSATTSQLTGSGVSAPKFLETILKQAFARYMKEAKYAPGDELGYVYAFHTDTRNLHIQMSVFPRTKQGAQVKLTEMVRSSEKREDGKPFINNLTRYACEAAEEELKRIYGRTELDQRPARDVAHALFRSQRVYELYATIKPGPAYANLEQVMAEDFRQQMPEPEAERPSISDLLSFFRRYVGATEEQSKKPLDYGTKDVPGNIVRRMSRLWMSFQFQKLEQDADAEKQKKGAAAPGLPANLLTAYEGFWRRAREVKPDEQVGQDVKETLRRKREALAKDIQLELLPDPTVLGTDLKKAAFWTRPFMAYLDKHMLFGAGVFFTRFTLRELELAVQLRQATVRFLRREAVGLPVRADRAQGPIVAPDDEAKPRDMGPDKK